MEKDENKDGLQKKEVRIDAFDFFIVMLKHKKLILTVVIGAGLITALYGLFLKGSKPLPPPTLTYRSDCELIINVNNHRSVLNLNAVLMAEIAKSDLIQKRTFLKCQQAGKKYFENMTYEAFGEILRFEADSAKQILTVAVTSKNAQSSQNILSCVVSQLSGVLKDDDIEPLEVKRSYLLNKYQMSKDGYQKKLFLDRLVVVDEQIFTIKNMKYYYPGTLKTSSVPQVQPKGGKWINPIQDAKPISLILWTVIAMFMALLVSITIAFLLEYFQNLKAAAPEKQRAIERLLRFRDRD
jgi:capsular polysaccharide biosynthesis protein